MKHLELSRYDPLIDHIAPDYTTSQTSDLYRIRKIANARHDDYATVSAKTNWPIFLIVAIHYRESDLDFTTYLHQGDPLGKPCVHEPRFPQVPVFSEWIPAAVDALKMDDPKRMKWAIGHDTANLYKLCCLAEEYNGLGYFFHDHPSPYVLSGTTGYKRGKFVGDHEYDPNCEDRQLGVLPILWELTNLYVAPVSPP